MENENLTGKEKKPNIFKRKEIWISGIIGILIGGLLIYLLGVSGVLGLRSKTIATIKTGKITENELYKEMKKYYPISYVLELVDKSILENKYKLTEEQKKEIEDQTNSYINMYQLYYGYTEEEFLNENGFESKEDFINYLGLDYKRNLYCIDYFKTLIPEEDIKSYYNDNVYGQINTKHMLIQISEDTTEEQALKLAKEIVTKLSSGTSFEDVANEYADKITSEEVKFNSFDSDSLESEYVEAAKKLEDGKYTEEPVKTSFGYHVIYRINQDNKPTLEEVENDIVEILGKNLEEKDQYIRYKALIKLREDNGLKFKDTKFEEEYKKYCNQVSE